MLLAIDPGETESAYVLWDGYKIHGSDKVPNDELISRMPALKFTCNLCAIEMIASYGMAVGAEVFETCVWIGRFLEAFGAERCDRITRGVVKMHLCHSMKANDANIRQAIIDRFGGKKAAIGKKKTPGPLYGISGDIWAALAVALTWTDQHANPEAA